MTRAGARDPITKVRSAWTETPSITLPSPDGGTHTARCWQRNVHDGHLTAMVDQVSGEGWHLSVSHRTNHTPPRPGRYPTWDEIADARDELLPADVGFAMHLPADGFYVAVHPTTFHLHQHPPAADA